MKRILYLLTLISLASHSQYVQLGNKLVGTGNTGQSWQGRSVSISTDGKTAIVGGSGDNLSVGAVWIYTWNGNNFVQFGNKLVGSGYVGGSEQGHTVDISSDGKVAIVGGIHDDNYGAAWIYTFNGTSFVQAGNKLVGTGVTYHGGIGTGVSISGDGKTVVLAAGYNDGGVGAFWIYTFNGSNFVQAGNKMSVSGSVGGSIIGSCQISLDGKTIVVGGGTDNGNTGAIWIFTFNGSNFVQAGSKLVGSNAIGSAYQGQSVSISEDGKTILAGGAHDNSTLGCAWIYTFNGTNYVQAGNKLVGTGAITTTGVYQGASTSLSSDGKTAWIGGNWDDSYTGAIWVFTFNGSSFVQAGNKMVASGWVGTPYNGTSISLSGDGKTAITGGIYDNTLVGAAWIFVDSTTTCTAITNVSISGFSATSNCNPMVFSAISNASGFYNWSTTSGVISNPTSSTISVSWVTPGIYPLSVTVFNGCSIVASTINVTVNSNLTVTSINKPIIGRNENNLIVNNTISGVNYQWLLNSTYESGQNSYIHTKSLEQGTYQVSAISLANCSIALSDPRDILPIIVLITVTNYEIKCVTAIDDLQKSSVEVYPNPGSGLFNLKTENISIGKIEVFNAQGKIIYNTIFNKIINLNDQPSGIYLLKIYDESQNLVKTSRLIIE